MNGEPLANILPLWTLNSKSHITAPQRCFCELMQHLAFLRFVALQRLECLVLITARQQQARVNSKYVKPDGMRIIILLTN